MVMNTGPMNAAHPQSSPPDRLSNQLAHLQQAFNDVHMNTMAILKRHVESAVHLETEVATLQKKNHNLREWTANANFDDKSNMKMAGTGESFASPDNGSWGNKGIRSSQPLEANEPNFLGVLESLESCTTVFPPIPGIVIEQVEPSTIRRSHLQIANGSQSQETQNAFQTRTDPQDMGIGLTSVIPFQSSTQLTDSYSSIREITSEHCVDVDKLDRRRAMRHSLESNGLLPNQRQTEKNKTVFGGVFMHEEELKNRVRQAICQEEYSVFDYYHEHGFWQDIAKSNHFKNITYIVIGVNALWMALDTELNDKTVLSEAHPVFQVMEHMFCAYFSAEILVRFLAFKHKKNCLKDQWFIFDALLAVMMIFDTWVISIVFACMNDGINESSLSNASILRLVRLVRIVRMARMAKLVRLMPQLMILLKGMMVATQTVFYTLCLLMLLIYIFAIAFMQLTKGTSLGDEHFSSMFTTMGNLLLNGILPDQATFVGELGKEHILFAILMLIYILIGSLTIMNMLVGVLVGVVQTVSSIEKEQIDVNFVKNHLLTCIKRIDANHDQQISKREFQALLETPEAAKALLNIGVDVVGLVDFMDYIFEEDTEVSFPQFMETVLQLRGTNTATVKDIVDLRKFMAQEIWNLESKLNQSLRPDAHLSSPAITCMMAADNVENDVNSADSIT